MRSRTAPEAPIIQRQPFGAGGATVRAPAVRRIISAMFKCPRQRALHESDAAGCRPPRTL